MIKKRVVNPRVDKCHVHPKCSSLALPHSICCLSHVQPQPPATNSCLRNGRGLEHPYPCRPARGSMSSRSVQESLGGMLLKQREKAKQKRKRSLSSPRPRRYRRSSRSPTPLARCRRGPRKSESEGEEAGCATHILFQTGFVLMFDWCLVA